MIKVPSLRQLGGMTDVSQKGRDHAMVDEDRKSPGRVARRRHFREPIRFFTVAEVAERLGVSTRTIRRWIEDLELVAHRFGRAVRIAESDLKAFLAMHRDD
jgi:excisionase family DNA binding protein